MIIYQEDKIVLAQIFRWKVDNNNSQQDDIFICEVIPLRISWLSVGEVIIINKQYSCVTSAPQRNKLNTAGRPR